MRGSDFADLKAFCTVARELSFARAAARLGVSSPALSQTIRGLEDRLGIRLFNRTTRSVATTDAGRLLYNRVAPLFSGFEDALAEVAATRTTPAGSLRINMPRIAAQHLICPRLSVFNATYPSIELEIAVDDRISDIIADGYDAGIRLGERLEKDMIAVKLGGEMRMAAVASPSYLAKHGAPATPSDLRDHRCIRFRWPTSGAIYDWEFERGNETFEVSVAGPLIVNDTAAMTEAALGGLGISYCLEIESQALIDAGKLTHVLPDWSPRFPGFYLYHSSRRLCPPQLSAFIDFFSA
jgi:DNA-binding transcriptional LysR family regulator